MDVESRASRIAAVKREIRKRSYDGIERRTISAPVEVRAEGDSRKIAGYGYVFNSLSENLGGFREVIAPGAGAQVIAKGPDVRGLFNHNPDLILGRTTSGTMRIGEDEKGGWYEIDPPDTSYANDLMVSLERGDVTQSSFAFRVARGGEEWDEDENGVLIRTITKFSDLFDQSPVTYPAYEAATSGVRTVDLADEERDDAPESDDVEAEASTTDVPAIEPDTAPNDERVVDEVDADQRDNDGDIEGRQADEPSDEQGGTPALGIRRRRMSALQAMGNAPN